MNTAPQLVRKIKPVYLGNMVFVKCTVMVNPRVAILLTSTPHTQHRSLGMFMLLLPNIPETDSGSPMFLLLGGFVYICVCVFSICDRPLCRMVYKNTLIN